MKNREVKRMLQKDNSYDGPKRKHLVFIGQESLTTAQAVYVSCCMYVSARLHRHYN